MKLTLIYHCHLIHRLHSSSTSCPDNILYSRRTQTRITYGIEFSSLFSFLPSWTVSSSVFLDISFFDFWRLQAGYSVELLSVWVRLMCLHDYIAVVAGIFLAGNHRSNVMCSLHPIRWCTNSICLMADDVYFNLLKWYWPGFFTAKLIFLSVINYFMGLSYLLLEWLQMMILKILSFLLHLLVAHPTVRKKFSLFSLHYLFISAWTQRLLLLSMGYNMFLSLFILMLK